MRVKQITTNQRRKKTKIMNDKFDELARGLAQSVTRRGALKKFGVGLAGVALASLGLVNKAEAAGCLESCVKPCVAAGVPHVVCHKSCKSLCRIVCC